MSQELANGNPEVTMMDLRKKLREYPGLDKYYLGEVTHLYRIDSS